MSCSCNGNCDLVDINNLVLSDTFHTWYDRTNQVIDTLNNVQMYDINVSGTGSGLTSITTCDQSGNYNGVKTIAVLAGPGIGLGTNSYYSNRVMIDTVGLTAYNGATGYETGSLAAFPANTDWFVLSDRSDTTLSTGDGTPKKIMAQQILPPTVWLPSGFQMNGAVQINGNLTVSGVQSVIDSNNVLIEDKAIEVAYRRFVQIDVTGPTSGVVPNTFPAAGMTFNYYDAGVGSTANPTTIGKISEVTFRGAQTTLKLHNFIVGGVTDIAPLGRLSITGTRFDFTMAAGPTTTESFFNDDELDEAGLIVKGASGDKNLLWVYKEGTLQDEYNAFVSSNNLGVSGSSNAIIASKFRSYGYNNSNDNTFQFMGYKTAGKPKIILGGATGDSTANQFGYWSIQHDNGGGTSTQQPLVWSFNQYASGTEDVEFRIWSGASGPTYPTVNVTGQSNNRVVNFASGLNVDFLDGAHGTTMPTAWSIPVALTGGTIADGWISPTALNALTKCYTQASHGLVMGDVVRIDVGTGSITHASADDESKSEVLGVVSKVNGNEFCVVTEGYISGLTGTVSSNIASILPLTKGRIYSLLNAVGGLGKMYGTSYAGLGKPGANNYDKPVMLATDVDTGYILNFPALPITVPTDTVEGMDEVGMILPYSGPITIPPTGWLLCDGSPYRISDYVDLFDKIQHTYYSSKIIEFQGFEVGDEIYLDGDYQQTAFLVGAAVRFSIQDEFVVDAKYVEYSNSLFVFEIAEVVDLTAPPSGQVLAKVQTRNPNSGEVGIFFVPDLREKMIVGTSTDQYSLGYLGGNKNYQITQSNLPSFTANSPSLYKQYIRRSFFPDSAVSGISFANRKTYFVDEAAARRNYADSVIPNSGPTNPTWQSFYNRGDHIEVIGGQTSTSPGDNAAGSPFNLNASFQGDNQEFDLTNPYVAMNYIIRHQRRLSARILTGHNHDDRYHRLNANMEITGAGLRTGNIRSKGFTGFNVFANKNVLGDSYGGTAYILSVVAHDTTAVNSGVVGDVSRTEVYVQGDLSVWGNGITGYTTPGYTGATFKVSTLQNKIIIGAGPDGNFLQGIDPRPYPQIEFQDAGSVGSVSGIISGLGVPTDEYHAANKLYVDQLSAPANRYATTNSPDIESGAGISGVCVFNKDFFSVSSENGLVDIVRAPNPVLDGPLGLGNFTSFDVINGNEFLTRPNVANLANQNIFSCFTNNSPAANDSAQQVYVYGDFTVFGDGSTANSNGTIRGNIDRVTTALAVDPIKSSVTIHGNNPMTNGGRTDPPTLVLRNTQNQNNPVGVITGLTAPTQSEHAANKWYVDNRSVSYWITRSDDSSEGAVRGTNIPNFALAKASNENDTTPLVWDSLGLDEYAVRNILTNPIGPLTLRGPDTAPDILPGTYSISVNGVLDGGDVGGSSRPDGHWYAVLIITGYENDGTTPASRCKPYYDFYDDISGLHAFHVNGFVKIGTARKFTVELAANPMIALDGGINRTITNIMLTRIGD